ncbi:MAG: M23 family metallopeptidase, partial [Acidobacteriota bacterium]
MTSRALLALALALGCAARLEAATLPSADAVVAPGSLVRWPGKDLAGCREGDRRWAPLDGACWYAVDLLATGTVEVARVREGRTERRTLRVAPYPYPEQKIELQDDSKVNLSPQDLARALREEERVARLWSLDGPGHFHLPLLAPLDPLPAGGRFGSRRVFNGQPRSPHTGADFPAPAGTPVRAAADGRVVLAEDQFFPGRAVFVFHGDGLFTMYFHLSAILVRPGQQVKRGMEIGRVGATGRASGPHLHFGVRWHGARVDPG